MLEHLDTLAETAAKAISNIKFDKVVVWEGGGANGNGTSNTAELPAKHGPRDAADDAGHEGHRRRRTPRVHSRSTPEGKPDFTKETTAEKSGNGTAT